MLPVAACRRVLRSLKGGWDLYWNFLNDPEAVRHQLTLITALIVAFPRQCCIAAMAWLLNLPIAASSCWTTCSICRFRIARRPLMSGLIVRRALAAGPKRARIRIIFAIPGMMYFVRGVSTVVTGLMCQCEIIAAHPGDRRLARRTRQTDDTGASARQMLSDAVPYPHTVGRHCRNHPHQRTRDGRQRRTSGIGHIRGETNTHTFWSKSSQRITSNTASPSGGMPHQRTTTMGECNTITKSTKTKTAAETNHRPVSPSKS